jgi:hypothetical protein
MAGGYGGLYDKNKVYPPPRLRVGGDLVGRVEEDGESPGHCFRGVVDLV